MTFERSTGFGRGASLVSLGVMFALAAGVPSGCDNNPAPPGSGAGGARADAAGSGGAGGAKTDVPDGTGSGGSGGNVVPGTGGKGGATGSGGDAGVGDVPDVPQGSGGVGGGSGGAGGGSGGAGGAPGTGGSTDANVCDAPSACGTGCKPCTVPANGTPTCAAGACGFTCNTTFCKQGDSACIANTTIAACGASCMACTAPANGTPSCAAGDCAFTCNPNFCKQGTTACIANDTATACGTNCVVCTATRSNSVATCTGGACVTPSPCATGFTDCSGSCVKTDSPASCGTACRVCSAPENATPVCTPAKSCDFICNPGYCRQGNACVANTSPAACGATCATCTAGAHQTPLCRNGGCAVACEAGFGDCDGKAINGCEVDLTNNNLNCGRCNLKTSVSDNDANGPTEWCAARQPDPTAGNTQRNYACKLWTGERCTGSLCLHCVTAPDSDLEACCRNEDSNVNPVLPACCQDPANNARRQVCNQCQVVANLADCPCPTDADDLFGASQCCVDGASPPRYRYCASPTPCAP